LGSRSSKESSACSGGVIATGCGPRISAAVMYSRVASLSADVAQYWVHPGVIQSVLNDARISVSGAGVEAAAGGDPLGLLR